VDIWERMDPELRDTFSSLRAVDISDLAAARDTSHAVGALAQAAPDPRVSREDRRVPGREGAPEVLIRHYRPVGQDQQLPCLYWVHGGGHLTGSVDEHDQLMDHVAANVGCAVVSVEWRRSPENPFPAEMDDCYAGLAWIFEHAAELAIDRDRLAVGGASSGGGSAAGLALLARDRGEIPLCFQFLLYPMLDDRSVTVSSHAVTDGRVWNRESNLIGWRYYLGDAAGTDSASPYAAPTRAQDLAGLPPAFISVGELDLFLDEDIEYGQRLLQAGVPTELHVYAGAYHGSDLLSPDAALSRRMIRDRNEALLQAFA
jgi:acetyl esterase/lipase